MCRLPFSLALLGLLLTSTANYAVSQDAPAGKPQQPLPAKAMKSWENAVKSVQRNRETYDKANEKTLAVLQKDLEKSNPPVNVEKIIERFQTDVITQLDAHAKPPAPPPPEKGVLFHNGHRYKLVEESLTWTDAKNKCEAMGGYLLTIDDRVEQEFVTEKLKQFVEANKLIPRSASVWLGIEQDKARGTWVRTDGQPQVFSYWDGGVFDKNLSHAALIIDYSIWRSVPNDAVIGRFFVCEWDK